MVSQLRVSHYSHLALPKAPELVFGADADGSLAGQASRSLSETITRIKESENDPEAASLCKETDVYALGMVSADSYSTWGPLLIQSHRLCS